MKKYILILLLGFFGSVNLGVTEKYKPVASFEISKVTADYSKLTPYIPLFQSYVDSIPTVDNFGRVRNGIIVQGIVDVMNTDPSGVDLTEIEIAYVRAIVGGMYLAGSWQKSKAVYGFVGGNAWKHKWNWKDMRDLDAAFRIIWNGGITHNNLGIKGDGNVSTYGNTYINALSDLSTNSTHMMCYAVGVGKGIDLAAGALDVNSRLLLVSRFASNSFVLTDHYSDSGGGRIFQPVGNNDGCFITNRESSSSLKTIKSGIIIGSNTGTSIGSLPNNVIKIFNWDGSYTGDLTGTRNIRVASIGSGLTDQQAIQTSHVVTYSQGIIPGRQ